MGANIEIFFELLIGQTKTGNTDPALLLCLLFLYIIKASIWDALKEN